MRVRRGRASGSTPYGHGFAKPDAHSGADAFSCAYAYAGTLPYSYSDPDPNPWGWPTLDAYCNPYSDTHAYAKPHPNPNADSDTHAYARTAPQHIPLSLLAG